MKSLIKNKSSLYLVLGFLMFSMLCAPALAGGYNYNGFPLDTIKNGTVKGDVYVSYGDNFGLVPASAYGTPHTFVTNFTNVPTGSDVKWAELKIGVWGGSTSYAGWANTTLNGELLGNVPLNPAASPFPENVWEAGTGVWLVTDNTNATAILQNASGSNIQAVVNTSNTSVKFDGRVYGVALVVVYENDTQCYTQYWINQGLQNFHKNATGGIQDYNANFTWFNGSALEPCPLGNSTLTAGYFAGDYNQKDYLYFNAPNASDSPYNLSNFNWNRTAYADWLLGIDVANNMSLVYPDSAYHYNFDLKTFGVKNNMSYCDGNNYAIFWRGHGNDIPGETQIYDPPFPGINNETEGYYVPFLAVLNTTNITTYDFSEDTAGRAHEDLFAYKYQIPDSSSPTPNNVPSTEFTSTEYNNIKADDGTPQQNVTDATDNFAAHRFVFNTCCNNTSNFDAFNVTWDGRGYHDAGNTSNGAYLYIWNFNTGAYEELANCDGDGTEKTLTGEKTANLSSYINNGQVIVLAEQKTADDGDYHSHIETDYVKLLLKV